MPQSSHGLARQSRQSERVRDDDLWDGDGDKGARLDERIATSKHRSHADRWGARLDAYLLLKKLRIQLQLRARCCLGARISW